jgi:hypothetical protein
MATKAQSGKTTAKSAGSKTTGAKSSAAKAAAPGKKPDALQKPLQPSKELAQVVGSDVLPRGEVVSKVWAYIKKHDLQNPENRREILADEEQVSGPASEVEVARAEPARLGRPDCPLVAAGGPRNRPGARRAFACTL